MCQTKPQRKKSVLIKMPFVRTNLWEEWVWVFTGCWCAVLQETGEQNKNQSYVSGVKQQLQLLRAWHSWWLSNKKLFKIHHLQYKEHSILNSKNWAVPGVFCHLLNEARVTSGADEILQEKKKYIHYTSESMWTLKHLISLQNYGR